jgi:CHAT domain-containing protein
MIEDFSLFYAPSLTVLREMHKKRPSPSLSTGTGSTLLALGNPQLSREYQLTAGPIRSFEQLGPLPEAEKEVKTLERLYGAANSRILIGADARESRVKLDASRYAILHFATHGLLDDRNPMFSHLTLAQVAADTPEDGLLEAREIINMDLNAQMAVLSACQMARGRVGAGEGVIGMSWAFFVAGVPTTVASQWKVDSASTTSLMIEFHRRLTSVGAKAKETRAESLRQAALVLLRSDRYRHPFYWAGFVMVGDGL